MIAALRSLRIPAPNAALVPGRFTSSSCARDSRCPAAARVSPRTDASSLAANSSIPSGIRAGPCGWHPWAGRRRMNSATAACLRALM